MKRLISFIRDEEGVTAIEYALIAALIGVAVVTTVKGAGSKINELFTSITTSIP